MNLILILTISDPNEDYFEKQAEGKRERVSKNELQRLRNIARSTKLKLPGTSGIVPNVELSHKEDIDIAKHLAKHSTASMGKFVEQISDETEPRKLRKRQKFEMNIGNAELEKAKNLTLVDQILSEQKRKAIDML